MKIKTRMAAECKGKKPLNPEHWQGLKLVTDRGHEQWWIKDDKKLTWKLKNECIPKITWNLIR